jgi:ankyrin repeat protein
MSHAPAALLLALLLAGPAAAQTAQTRLWDAAMSGDTVEVAAALDAGADIDSMDTRLARNGRRALNWAALFDRAPVIRLLLARGATLEARNRTGFSALHHAAEEGSAAAARVLLDAGADPRATNNAGMTPAQVARAQGNVGVAQLLETAAGAAGR